MPFFYTRSYQKGGLYFKMKILEELLSSLKEDSIVREVHVCVFWTAVLSKNCGLASTLHEGHPYHKIVRDPGKLRGKSALELAEYAKSDRLLEASIGMAAINSLIDIDETRCITKNAFDILAEKGSGKNIAIVGHFPWIPKLKKIARNLFVGQRALYHPSYLITVWMLLAGQKWLILKKQSAPLVKGLPFGR
jgi:uncharacterized protein (DUF4213/DUF364 family)